MDSSAFSLVSRCAAETGRPLKEVAAAYERMTARMKAKNTEPEGPTRMCRVEQDGKLTLISRKEGKA